MSVSKLLPCPLCGSKDTFLTGGDYYVVCKGCGVEGPWNDDDPDLAVAAWNKRADPQYEYREAAAINGVILYTRVAK